MIRQELKTYSTVRCLVMNMKKEVLLLQKSYTSKAPGVWEWPGGKVENDMSIEKVAVKELYEETGISPRAFLSNYSYLGKFEYFFETGSVICNRQVDIFGFLVDYKHIIIGQKEEDNHISYQWVPFHNIQNCGLRLNGNTRFEKLNPKGVQALFHTLESCTHNRR